MLNPEMQTAFAVIGAIGGIVGIVGGGFGVASYFNSRRQTRLMEAQAAKEERDAVEELMWSERFEKLATQLSRINSGLCVTDQQTQKQRYLYSEIFTDPKMRGALEIYIVQPNPSYTQFKPRIPGQHELKRAVLRETIISAEKCMAEFQAKNPGINLSYYMG